MSDKLKIEQRHRDAAASYGLWRIYSGLGAESIKEGRADNDDLVQAFAQFEADYPRTPTPEMSGNYVMVPREALNEATVLIEVFQQNFCLPQFDTWAKCREVLDAFAASPTGGE